MGLYLTDAKLTLVGHTYCFENCTVEMLKRNIGRVEILGEDGRIDVVLDLTNHPVSVLDDKALKTTPAPLPTKNPKKKSKKKTKMSI